MQWGNCFIIIVCILYFYYYYAHICIHYRVLYWIHIIFIRYWPTGHVIIITTTIMGISYSLSFCIFFLLRRRCKPKITLWRSWAICLRGILRNIKRGWKVYYSSKTKLNISDRSVITHGFLRSRSLFMYHWHSRSGVDVVRNDFPSRRSLSWINNIIIRTKTNHKVENIIIALAKFNENRFYRAFVFYFSCLIIHNMTTIGRSCPQQFPWYYR